MECAETKKLLDAYLDDEIIAEMRHAVEIHLEHCADCRAEVEKRRAFYQALAALPEEELPAGFMADFQARVAAETPSAVRKRPISRRPWLRVAAAAACLLLAVGVLAGIAGTRKMGASSSAPMAAPMGDGYAMYDSASSFAAETPREEMRVDADNGEVDSGVGLQGTPGQTLTEEGANNAMERKIIRNWYLSLEVGDYDNAYAAISEIAARYNGYVVRGDAYRGEITTSGSVAIRVAYNQAEAAVAEISGLGELDDSSFNSDDVTMEYYDISARLTQCQAQEERLLALYEQAQSVEEIISVENKLVNVQSEIESLQGQIRYYDQMTTLSMIEVYLYTPSDYSQSVEPRGWQNFAKNVSEGFLSGLNDALDFFADLVIWIVRHLVLLLVLAALVVLAVVLLRRRYYRS